MIRGAAVVAVAFVAACGGGGAAGEGDPASVVPADALVYVEAVVRPEGSQRDDALEALGKVLRTDDPSGRIRELTRDAVGEFDYERDLEPWLGERVGFWATDEGDEGVAVVAATDTDEAREALDRRLREDGQSVTERSHRGVEYLVNSDGVAGAVVDDFAAVGREADVKRTIDASEGDSLAEADAYTDAVGELEDDRLATFWMNSGALFEQAVQSDPELEELRSLVPLDEFPPVAGGFRANGERLALEVAARSDRDIASILDGGTPLLQELPGDSWAAFGIADVGPRVQDAIDQYGGAIGGVAIRGQIRRDTGLDLDRDLLDWIGHMAVFVRGTTPDTVDGGLVIQPTDEDKAADAFGRIAGAIQRINGPSPARPIDVAGADQAFAFTEPEAPRPIVFARGSGVVVLTYGEPAAEAALGADDRLGDTDTYDEAEELVGMEPSLLVSMPAVLELADAAGASADPDYTEMKPYLEVFSVFAAGVIADDDEFTAHLGAGLR
jgi:hypothetical protein